MEKKYVVCCEHDLIGVFYLKSDGYFSENIRDAVQYNHRDAIKLVHRFNIGVAFSQHIFYYVADAPVGKPYREDSGYYYRINSDGEVVDNA